MSLVTQVSNLATRVGTEFKTVYSKIGTLSSLTTTEKSNLVGAINELKTNLGAQINDTTASTTTTYSSTKVNTLLGAKLDSSSYTAADVLSKLLTVDGSGSGLDADTLDGISSAGFATAGHNHDSTYQPLDGDLTAIAGIAGTSGLLKKTAADTWSLDTTTYLAASSYTASDVLSKLLTVDGAGSGLDADTLDGLSSTAFSLSGHNHDSTYQPLDGDLTSIAGLSGTSGILKKTAANTWTLDTTSYATSTDLTNYVPLSSKDAANGVAGLDASGLLSTSVLPPLAITSVNVVSSQSAMLALSAQEGDVAIRTDLNKSFILSNNTPGTLANWKELLTPTDAVSSVDGRTGTVTLSDLYAAKSLETNVGDTTTNFVTVFEAALV